MGEGQRKEESVHFKLFVFLFSASKEISKDEQTNK